MRRKKQSTKARKAETVLVKLNLPRGIHTRLRAFAAGSNLTVGEAAAKILDQGLPTWVVIHHEKSEPRMQEVVIHHEKSEPRMQEVNISLSEKPGMGATRKRKSK